MRNNPTTSACAPASPARTRAAALVLTLWLILIVGLLLLGLNRNAQVTAALAAAELERVQAHWLARAGIERALATLAADGLESDSITDFWYSDPGVFENIELATGYTYRVTAPPDEGSDRLTPRFGLDDEAARVNVNSNKPSQLQRILGITDAQAAAITDWADRNEEATPGGAERGYYNDLTYPYLIRNAPLRTHREMLLVRGITHEDFFGEDTDHDGVLDRNENDGAESWPDDNADRVLDRGLAAQTTVYAYDKNTNPAGSKRINLKQTDDNTLMDTFSMTQSLAARVREKAGNARTLFDFVGVRGQGEVGENEIGEITAQWLANNWEELTLSDDERVVGLINVNTAGRAVLETVPDMEPKMADTIINYRRTQGAILGLGDLYPTVLTEEQFRKVAEHLTVRSHVFRIVSEGRTPSGNTQTLTAIVDRGGEQPVILDWRQHE